MKPLFVDDPLHMCVTLDSSWSHYQPALMMDASFYIRRMEPKRVSNVQNYIGSLLIMYSWAWEKENKSLMYVRHMYIQRTYCFTIYLTLIGMSYESKKNAPL